MVASSRTPKNCRMLTPVLDSTLNIAEIALPAPCLQGRQHAIVTIEAAANGAGDHAENHAKHHWGEIRGQTVRRRARDGRSAPTELPGLLPASPRHPPDGPTFPRALPRPRALRGQMQSPSQRAEGPL